MLHFLQQFTRQKAILHPEVAFCATSRAHLQHNGKYWSKLLYIMQQRGERGEILAAIVALFTTIDGLLDVICELSFDITY